MRRERRPKQAKPSQSCGSGRKALFFLTVVGGGRKRGGFSRSIGRFLTICLSFLSLGDVDDQFRPSSFSLSLSLVGKEEKNCQSRLDEPSSSFFFSLSLSCVHYVVLTSRYPSVCLVVALSLSLSLSSLKNIAQQPSSSVDLSHLMERQVVWGPDVLFFAARRTGY